MMIEAASRPFEMRFIGPEDYEALEAEWAIGSPEQPVSTEARQLSARRGGATSTVRSMLYRMCVATLSRPSRVSNVRGEGPIFGCVRDHTLYRQN